MADVSIRPPYDHLVLVLSGDLAPVRKGDTTYLHRERDPRTPPPPRLPAFPDSVASKRCPAATTRPLAFGPWVALNPLFRMAIRSDWRHPPRSPIRAELDSALVGPIPLHAGVSADWLTRYHSKSGCARETNEREHRPAPSWVMRDLNRIGVSWVCQPGSNDVLRLCRLSSHRCSAVSARPHNSAS